MKSEGRVHDEGEDDDEDEEEDEADNKLADSLQVFCCSATEYQRIQNPLPDDEPPKVIIQIRWVCAGLQIFSSSEPLAHGELL